MVQYSACGGCSYRLHDNVHPWDRKAAGHGMIKTTDLKLVPPSPLIHKYAAYMVDRIHNYAIVQNTEVKAYSIDPDRHLVMLS